MDLRVYLLLLPRVFQWSLRSNLDSKASRDIVDYFLEPVIDMQEGIWTVIP